MAVKIIRESDSQAVPVEYAVSADEIRRRVEQYKRKYGPGEAVQEE